MAAFKIAFTSKFKHVYCEGPRPEATWQNIRLSTVTGDQQYIKANPLFYAVGLQGGGGPFTVINCNKPGRVEDPFVFSGHTAAVLDFDFNPFDDHVIASGSDDTTVKVWRIPQGGLTENITTPIADLHGHGKKVTLLRYNPTVNGCLLSSSGDQTVKVWDVENQRCVNTNSSTADLIQDIVWDYRGNNYATASRDKKVRIIEGRSGNVFSEIENAHEGSKAMKVQFLGDTGRILTTGCNKMAQRQMKVWDMRNLSVELKKVEIDSGAGVLMPFYDADTGVLYLAGKGDGNVRVYEITSDAPYCHGLTDFKSSVSAKGMAWVPKRGLNILGCESARLLKLTTNSVEPLSFTVPRKGENFQSDLYYDTPTVTPAHGLDAWIGGSDLPPVCASLDPSGKPNPKPSCESSGPSSPLGGGGGASRPNSSAMKSAVQLQLELDAANARIKRLEDLLAQHNISE